MIDTLLAGFTVRAPGMDDLEGVSAVITACDIADCGKTDISLEEIRTVWQSPHFQLETDAYVVATPEGRIVGYGDVEDREHVRLYSFVRVHPEYWALKREGFNPSLWFLAVAGGEIAGLSLCKYEMDLGWVDTLAVLRPWRRKGLGMALLRHSFAEFYRRGYVPDPGA